MAAAAGADAIGMVFHPAAPRHISTEQARSILAVVPAFVTPVAVFVDPDVEYVRAVMAELHLRHVQLNGDESPEYVAKLSDLAVIKAIRVDPGRIAGTLQHWRDAIGSSGMPHLKALVLDTPSTTEAGGTGVPNNWRVVREQQQHGGFAGLPSLIAAGGLSAQSVGAVVRDLRPWAVDVSSGVEESRGIKSRPKVEAFVAAVRDADADSAGAPPTRGIR
jgi:phosphoribosylanthranilate isomerase